MARDNFVQIVGSVGGDPELRYTTGGIAVATFSVAWTPRKKGADGDWEDGETSWFRCTAWRDMAENVAASVTKGMRVVVTGSVVIRKWEDNEGNDRYSTEIQLDEVAPSLRWAQAHIERNEREKTDVKGPPAGGGGTSGHGYDYPDEEPF